MGLLGFRQLNRHIQMRRGVEGVDRSDFRAGTRNLLRMMW